MGRPWALHTGSPEGGPERPAGRASRIFHRSEGRVCAVFETRAKLKSGLIDQFPPPEVAWRVRCGRVRNFELGGERFFCGTMRARYAGSRGGGGGRGARKISSSKSANRNSRLPISGQQVEYMRDPLLRGPTKSVPGAQKREGCARTYQETPPMLQFRFRITAAVPASDSVHESRKQGRIRLRADADPRT